MRIRLYDAFEDKKGKAWIVAEIDGKRVNLRFAEDLNQEMELSLDTLRQKIKEGELKRLK